MGVIRVSIELWSAFVVASALLVIIPGPTNLTIISYSVAHGRSAYFPLVVAVALGDGTALCLSALGLGALLAASAFWFTVAKWIGGLYLLYLGIKLLRAGVSPGSPPKSHVDSYWQLFANSYLVTAFNPKGILFFSALLPQFIHPGENVSRQLWILGVTFVVLSATSALLYAVFSGYARRMLASSRAQRNLNVTGGSLLSAAGVWVLLAKRPA